MNTRIFDLRRIKGDELKNEDLVLLSIVRKGKSGERLKESVTVSLGDLKSFVKDNRYREPVSGFVEEVKDIDPLFFRYKNMTEKIRW